MADELLDLVNDKDEVIGTVLRNDAHKNPDLIHREVVVALFNNEGKTLLQQRSMNKSEPGSWKITLAGHVASGEASTNAANRELQEELSLKVELEFYKKIFQRKENESKFYWMFYAIVEGEPERNLDPNEVMDSAWVKVNDLEEFSKTHDYSLTSVSHSMISEIYKEKVQREITKN